MSYQVQTAAPAVWRLSRRGRLACLVGILLVASLVRFVGLDNTTPPGLEHDEVAHWLINLDILAGNHAIYFTDAYGHEALFHYVQAYFGVLTGDNALMLRLPAAYFGVLLVAVSYTLGRRLFGWPAGLFAAAFLAVLLWPVFYSRLALRAISLPVLSGLAAYFWWVGWGPAFESPRTQAASVVDRYPVRLWPFVVGGVLAGLTLHTYMAARAVPIFFALFLGYLLLFQWPLLRRRWRGVALFWLAFALVALPLVWFLVANPGAEDRIAEVDAPLRALLAGDFGPVLENSWRILAMFGVAGDPLWRQNVADWPTFGWLMGALFYAGVGLSLWRWRDSRYAFMLLWLAASVLPSVATIDAPSSIRIVNLLPFLMLFPYVFIHKGVELSTAWDKFSTRTAVLLMTGLVAVSLLFTTARMVNGLWRVWPASDEVQFVWQVALTEAAAALDASSERGPVAVGGWTPETMDPPTMELTLRRDDLSLRYFDPQESVIVPGTTGDAPSRIVYPAALPLAELIQARLGGGMLTSDPAASFVSYAFASPFGVTPDRALAADFGGELQLLGYDLSPSCAEAEAASCQVLTHWRVVSAPDGPRRFFLHMVDEEGGMLAQDDRLGAPAAFWQAGDTIMQQFALPALSGTLRLGVYDPDSSERLPVAAGEFVELNP